MNLIPFGEVLRDRYEISLKFGLIEKSGGIWRLTTKCKSNYDCGSYFRYLQGRVEKPSKITDAKPIEQKPLTPAEEIKTDSCQQIISEILNL